MAGDSGLMRARAPQGQMQLHALTGSHQEEAAVNSNSLRMVMELTVFVGRGRGARGKSTGKRRSGGVGLKLLRARKQRSICQHWHVFHTHFFWVSFTSDSRGTLFQLITVFAQKLLKCGKHGDRPLERLTNTRDSSLTVKKKKI